MRHIVAVLSDTHGGFTLGLMNPAVTLYDETKDGELVPYQPEPTASQDYLWELYSGHVSKLREIAGADPVTVIHNGDLTHGNKHPSALVSDRMANQIIIGVSNLAPLMEIPNVKHTLIVAGTEAHNFGQGSSEILATEILRQKYPERDISVLYHGVVEVSGVIIDYSHHGPYPGSREWLRGNVVRLYLKDLMLREIINGRNPPALVLRGHYHQHVEEVVTTGIYSSRLIVTPAYCMLGDYAHQAARSPDSVTNGMIAVEIVDGKIVEIHRLMKTVDIRTRKVIT